METIYALPDRIVSAPGSKKGAAPLPHLRVFFCLADIVLSMNQRLFAAGVIDLSEHDPFLSDGGNAACISQNCPL